MLPRKSLVVGTLTAPEDLSRNDDVRAFPAEFTDGLSHDLFGSAIGVDFGVVEEVDAVITATLEERLGFFDVELVSEAYPCSVG